MHQMVERQAIVGREEDPRRAIDALLGIPGEFDTLDDQITDSAEQRASEPVQRLALSIAPDGTHRARHKIAAGQHQYRIDHPGTGCQPPRSFVEGFRVMGTVQEGEALLPEPRLVTRKLLEG